MSNAPERPNLESRLAELEHDHRDHCEYCHDMFRMGLESQALIIRINQNNINTNRYILFGMLLLLFSYLAAIVIAVIALCVAVSALVENPSTQDRKAGDEKKAITMVTTILPHLGEAFFPNTAP